MRRGAGWRFGIAAAVAGTIIAVGAWSQATTIPIPKGVVVGRQRFSSFCGEDHCTYRRLFTNVRVVGRLKGVLVVAATSAMVYDSYQYFCTYNCGPTPPLLVNSFTITGTTAARVPFRATCTSGGFAATIAEVPELTLGWVSLPMVSAACNGGPSGGEGPIEFRFVLPGEEPFGLGGPFAGILVEA